MQTAMMPQRTTFDFQTKKVEIMDLPTLKMTHMEDDHEGNPQRGLYHYQAIERTEQICQMYHLNYKIEEIFAAHNNSKHQPGVSILRKEEVIHGEKAVPAHILRRIFTTIQIMDFETEELTTTIVLTYHQDGMQAAIGPCMRACHNQCVMGAGRMVSTYGKNKVTIEQFFETIDVWLSEFETQMTEDRERIQRLRNTLVSEQEVYMYVGLLTALRVAHDSADEELSARVEHYPLNQSQISTFTEAILKKMKDRTHITAWDLYNTATEEFKPDKMNIPSIVYQNVAFVETLDNFCRIKQPTAIPVEAVVVN